MNKSRFSADHIRVLASWSEKLGLAEYRISLFNLYQRMVITNAVTDEEITSSAMSAIQVIRDVEPNKEMFYHTMTAWGL